MKEKKEIQMKKEGKIKGITLIALVITIIVMLILAGVTIGTLFGENGILTRSNQCKGTSRNLRRKRSYRISSDSINRERNE